MPLSVRNVEVGLQASELAVSAGTVRDHVTQEDADVLHWYARLQRLEEGFWTRGQVVVIDGQLRQVLGYNISNTRCLHYIVNGFEPNEEGDHTRHYGPHQLAEATKESELR